MFSAFYHQPTLTPAHCLLLFEESVTGSKLFSNRHKYRGNRFHNVFIYRNIYSGYRRLVVLEVLLFSYKTAFT